jgi:glyoxylase-like metal-dependent hydrolase (beta-lactamase superfamily II)
LELLAITDSLYLVPGQNNGRFPFSQSVYVDAERRILFDAGIGPKLLRQFLKSHPVDIVIVSHTHPDHIAGCGLLSTVAPIFVPAESEDSFGDLDKLAARFVEGETETDLWKKLVLGVMRFKPAKAARTYDGRSAFDLGSVKLLAIHTPGHLEDHYCFYEEHSGVMLLFDIDLSPYGPWYGHRESSVDKLEASVALVRSYNPQIAVSSHMGLLRKNVDQALERYIGKVQERDEQILKLVAEGPATLTEIAGHFPFTPTHHPQLAPVILYWEKQMVGKHLDRLMEAREIGRDGDIWRKR